MSPVPREVGIEYGIRCAHGPIISFCARRASALRAPSRIPRYIASVSY